MAVDPEDVLLGLGLETLDTLLSAIAWLDVEALPISTAYAVAVAGNDVLPASLGTLVTLVMLAVELQARRHRRLPCRLRHPVTFRTIMSVAGGNSLANVVSVTPGGAGVNQAVNSALDSDD